MDCLGLNMTKYNNKKVTIDGYKFDSQKEGCRYKFLKKMEEIGNISNLELQTVFELAPSVIINGRKKPALKYKADFTYIQNGNKIIEDVKGVLTAVYKIKRHLMKSIYGIDILET